MMPQGPKGEKRPADVIGAAVMVARIAIGEIETRPLAAQTIEEPSATWFRCWRADGARACASR
jgi:hypothetical protein